jgi:hypothetical protein
VAGRRVEIDIAIRQAAIVAGVVRDEGGNPVVSASVEVRSSDASTGPAAGIAVTARTGPDGAYRAFGLAPGDYRVVALSGNQPIGSRESPVRLEGLAGQFFPLADAASHALALTLEANSERLGVDFTLRRRPLTRVTGRLVLPDGVSIHDQVLVIVTGIEETPPVISTPIVLAGGEFVASLHPGRYRADARTLGSQPGGTPPGQGQPYFASAILEVPDEAAAVFEIPLRPGARVSARVRAIGETRPEVGIRLLPQPERPAVVRPVDLATTGDGRFSANGTAPGRYAVELVDPGRVWVLDAVNVDGTPRLDRTVTVGANEAIELVVAPRTSSLSGRLLGADPHPSAYVLMLLRNDAGGAATRGPEPYLARADNTGRYTFTGCRAGAYVLALLRDFELVDLRNPEFLNELRRHQAAVAVSLHSGTETTLDLRVGTVLTGDQRIRR